MASQKCTSGFLQLAAAKKQWQALHGKALLRLYEGLTCCIKGFLQQAAAQKQVALLRCY
jgi:hypothetical protein